MKKSYTVILTAPFPVILLQVYLHGFYIVVVSRQVGDLILTYHAGGPVPEEMDSPAPPAKALPMDGDPLHPASAVGVRHRNGTPRGHAPGEVKASPRKEILYWTDDCDLLALRVGDWKIVFKEQLHKGLGV